MLELSLSHRLLRPGFIARPVFFCALMLAITLSAAAQSSPVGVWKTVDDKTGEVKSHIEIFQKDGKYHGKIVRLLRKPADTVCEKCPGERKNQRLVGMVIISDLKHEDDYWQDGSIMDPESGKEYGCSMWFEDGATNALKVRGKHWTGLYRTQTWYRIN